VRSHTGKKTSEKLNGAKKSDNRMGNKLNRAGGGENVTCGDNVTGSACSSSGPTSARWHVCAVKKSDREVNAFRGTNFTWKAPHEEYTAIGIRKAN